MPDPVTPPPAPAGGVATEVSGLDLCVLDHTARRAPAVAATPELLAALLAQRRR